MQIGLAQFARTCDGATRMREDLVPPDAVPCMAQVTRILHKLARGSRTAWDWATDAVGSTVRGREDAKHPGRPLANRPRLGKKLGADPDQPEILTTESGIGYRFIASSRFQSASCSPRRPRSS